MLNKIRTLFLMVLMTSTLANAAPNSVYIDQVGDVTTATVTQTGTGNSVGTELQRFTLNGNSQNITITQVGNNNSLNGAIKNGAGVTMNTSVSGDGNAVSFDYGDAASVAGTTTSLTINGGLNTVSLIQGSIDSSTNVTHEINITGDQNTYTSTINTNDVVNTFTLTGEENNVTMLQNGYNGKTVNAVLTGSNNEVVINQTSTLNVDSIALTSNINNGTITINQCNSGC